MQASQSQTPHLVHHPPIDFETMAVLTQDAPSDDEIEAHAATPQGMPSFSPLKPSPASLGTPNPASTSGKAPPGIPAVCGLPEWQELQAAAVRVLAAGLLAIAENAAREQRGDGAEAGQERACSQLLQVTA
jgi:hypothetical protein